MNTFQPHALKTNVLDYLVKRHGAAYRYWSEGAHSDVLSVEDHCDIVYSLFLMDELEHIHAGAATAFADLLRTRHVPGWSASADEPSLTVHNGAYAFGALNLLRATGHGDLFHRALAGREAAFGQIIDPIRKTPRYPGWLAHHNWRVSHWLGGAPSMLWSLGKADLPDAQKHHALAQEVLAATNTLLDPRTGLIRLYKSALLQKAFRLAYGLRHDPTLGDVGGVAHILWVNHAAGRPYVAAEALLKQSTALFAEHAPFMERVPYCLDFDVVQIVRTALEQLQADRTKAIARSRQMMTDIESFFVSAEAVPETYSLHKVPGALATYHECALICELPVAPALGAAAKDIIATAFWL